MSSQDEIVETFPCPTISLIIGQPNYEIVSEVHLYINANSGSVQSHLGNGALGLLFFTVLPAVYNTLNLIQFTHPGNPGSNPIIPSGSTGPQIADVCHQFSNAAKLYKQYNATDKALKQLLLGAVDDMFVRSLRNRHIRHTNVTTLQILTHLYTTYAKIKPSDLDANHDRMNAPYDADLLIKASFNQIEDSIDFASAGNAPFTPVQVVNTAFNVTASTGMFQDNCKIWKRKPNEEKTWTQFKIDFAIAHAELLDSSQAAYSAGFQANNMTYVQGDAMAAISRLVNAT